MDNVHQADMELGDICPFYMKCRDSVKFAHLNINSVRHKFVPVYNALCKGYINVLFVQETKLDS